MAESNVGKIVNILLTPNNALNKSVSKKDSETVTLGKIYNFLVKDRDEKGKRQQRLQQRQKQYGIQSASIITDATSPTATIVPKDKKDSGGMFGGLGMLGIVAAGVGVYVFSDEIQQKIIEIKEYFEETKWTDAFQKFEDLFDFSGLQDLIDLKGFGPISESVSKGSEISKFDTGQLNILTKGGKELLSESEFKQIQSQHSELSGMNFGDINANIAAQGFKASDIQKQLGTTDIDQTVAAEKIGVESTKKLYAAKSTQKATEVVSPEVARSNRNIFYKDTGEERTVGEVREQFAAQSRPPVRSSRPAAGSTKNAQYAVDYFQSQGWTKEQAAGIVGNLQHESGANLKYDSYNDKENAYGIAQWHADRQRNFEQVFGHSIRNSTLQEQLAFVQWELTHSESRAGKLLSQSQSAADAAKIINKYYERSESSKDVYSEGSLYRQSNARLLSGEISQGNAIPTSGGGGSIISYIRKFVGLTEDRDYDALNNFISTYHHKFDVRTQMWCGAFVNGVLGAFGFNRATDSATSFLNSPGFTKVDLNQAQPGDIVVVKSSHSNSGGHVGFLDSINSTGITMLGGNQQSTDVSSHGMVSVNHRRLNEIMGIVRPVGAGSVTPLNPIAQTPPPIPTQDKKPKSSGGTTVNYNTSVVVVNKQNNKIEESKHDTPAFQTSGTFV